MLTETRQHRQPGAESGEFETLISDLMGRFTSSPESQTDSEIEDAIRRTAEFLGFDQGLVVQWAEDGDLPLSTHSWTVPWAKPVSVFPDNGVPPWVHGQSIQGKIIMFSHVGDLPEETEQDKAFFRMNCRKSFISLPLKISGKVIGALVFASVDSEIAWRAGVAYHLQLIADVFACFLDQRKKQLELEERLRFEVLLAETSARLINLPTDRLDDEIVNTMRRVCECFNIDRSTILLLSNKGSGSMQRRHFYVRGCGPVSEMVDGAELFPWTLNKLLAGELLVISKLSDLPPEAARDIESFRLYDTKSLLVVPLSAGGSVFGTLTFSDVRQERKWEKTLVSRLKLVSEILVNAIVRQNAEKALRESERLREIEGLKERLENENIFLQAEVRQLSKQTDIVGQSAAMKRVLLQAAQVAQTDTTVLIMGETGTGKELLARAIHNMGARKCHPLMTVNCAALPPTLIESELFGREKGAFTGALTRMAGRFEVADRSTLFLDEVGELSPEMQVKLLRVIEDGTIERLGSTKAIRVDVRLIAATNRVLARDVECGRFRNDLFYRLNVFPLVIPPLRERPEDIPLLVWAFVEEFQKRMGKRIDRIPKKTMEDLQSYNWPGNGRELRNVIERAMIVSRGRTLEVFLPESAHVVPSGEGGLTIADIERRHVMSVLERTSWRVTGKGGAAEILGLKGTTLQSKLKKLGIKRPKSS
jgi:formate hydrogenlyase transcriptional activator